MSAAKSGSAPLLPDQYEVLLEAVRAAADDAIPRNATVLVVSRGDDELLRLGPRRAQHFPQDELGGYLGYHPHDSEGAIAMLERMRARGAQYLVLPSSSFWWLEHYTAFADHLQGYPAVVTGDDCMVFELASGFEPRRTDDDEALQDLLDALLPPAAHVTVLRRGSDLPGQLAATDADYAVVPAAIRETGAADHVEGWKLVTSQRYVGDLWEKSADRGLPPAPAGLWQRLRNLLP